MRRLSPGYCQRGRYVRSTEVPFKELLPMRLKTQVSTKGERSGGAYCIQEMSVFFACMKKNEFEEARCSNELQSFQKCVATHEAARHSTTSSAVPAPGEKNLSHRQLGALLKKYPG